MQRDKKFADARAAMKRIGARLVQERRVALCEGVSEGDTEKGREYGKDLLSLLVKANMTDPKASSMSDEDVQDREPTPFSDIVPVPRSHLIITTLTFFIPMQKSPPLSSPVTKRAARVLLGVFIVCPTISGHRNAYVTRFATLALIHQIWSRSSPSSTSITS